MADIGCCLTFPSIPTVTLVTARELLVLKGEGHSRITKLSFCPNVIHKWLSFDTHYHL